jgi:hypothetical protein
MDNLGMQLKPWKIIGQLDATELFYACDEKIVVYNPDGWDWASWRDSWTKWRVKGSRDATVDFLYRWYKITLESAEKLLQDSGAVKAKKEKIQAPSAASASVAVVASSASGAAPVEHGKRNLHSAQQQQQHNAQQQIQQQETETKHVEVPKQPVIQIPDSDEKKQAENDPHLSIAKHQYQHRLNHLLKISLSLTEQERRLLDIAQALNGSLNGLARFCDYYSKKGDKKTVINMEDIIKSIQELVIRCIMHCESV